MDIKNSVILITSAGSSLGGILANHYSSLGARVVATDTDQQKLDNMVLQCNGHAKNVYACPVKDYTDESIHDLFATIRSELNSTVDVLINYWPSSPLPALTSHDSAAAFSEKLSSLATPIFSFGQAGAEQMKSSTKPCVIINMITYPYEQYPPGYDSASYMVSGFTKSWAKELDEYNIRVGGVVPGVAHTVDGDTTPHWAMMQDELIRSTEYIVSNEYFNGRVVSAEM